MAYLHDTNKLYRIRSAGFDCIDVQDFVNVEGELYRMSDADFDRTVSEYRNSLDMIGLSVWQIHGPWRWPATDSDPDVRAEWLRDCLRAVRGAAMLGSRCFVIHPLMPYGAVDKDPVAVRALNVDFYTSLVEYGKKNDVIICIENMPFGGQALARPTPMLDFIKEIDSPYLRACIDTGHCAVLGLSSGDAVRLYGRDYIAALHVHDNNGVNDLHSEPFSGVIDWQDFSAALSEIGFSGVLSLEVKNPNFVENDDWDAYFRNLVTVAQRLIKEP